jgi:hypothetical protein
MTIAGTVLSLISEPRVPLLTLIGCNARKSPASALGAIPAVSRAVKNNLHTNSACLDPCNRWPESTAKIGQNSSHSFPTPRACTTRNKRPGRGSCTGSFLVLYTGPDQIVLS